MLLLLLLLLKCMLVATKVIKTLVTTCVFVCEEALKLSFAGFKLNPY